MKSMRTAGKPAKTRGALLVVALGLAGSVACGGGSSTFDVTMKVDKNTFDLSMVMSCEVTVSGADQSHFFLSADKHSKIRCTDGLQGMLSGTGADVLGTFGYTSSATSGAVSFKVDLFGDPNKDVLATGVGSGTAHEGSRTQVDLLIKK